MNEPLDHHFVPKPRKRIQWYTWLGLLANAHATYQGIRLALTTHEPNDRTIGAALATISFILVLFIIVHGKFLKEEVQQPE